jgi:ABC-type nitrate/sulfonate/bicarbonate transport system permease component
VPPLSEIFTAFRETWLFSHVGSDLIPSLRRLALGFGAAVLIGATLGFVFGAFPVLRMMFRPVTVFFRSIPPVTLIPIALLLFGISDQQKVFVIAFMCIWPILLNTEDGVAEIDPTARDSARAYGVSGPSYFWNVMLPATLPRIFAGMRTALAFALLLLVIAELVGSTEGLGFQVQLAATSYAMANMWAGVLMLGVLGYVLNLLLELTERRTIKWHYARGAGNA